MYLILGCGTAGYFVATRLKETKKELVIVENDKSRIEILKEQGFDNTIQGDMTAVSVLKRAGIEKADAVIILTTDPALNKRTLKAVRKLNATVPVIVRAGKESTDKEFKGEAEIVIYPTSVVAEAAIKGLEKIELKRKMAHLKEIISDASKGVAIVTQDNPDPDAIACALSLKRIVASLGKNADIIYSGEIGHEENKALINLLGIEMTAFSHSDDLKNYSKIALIESAIPGQNNHLDPKTVPDIIIDHHQVDMKKVRGDYVDIRPELGAASTMMTEYLTQLGIEIDDELATVLLYGIKTDTQDFTRGATLPDMNAVALLYPKANHDLLRKIESPLMSAETLDVLGEAIHNRKIRGSYLLSNVGFIRDRDTLPQAADYLLNLEGISTVLVYGIGKDVVHISARNRDIRLNLGKVMEMAYGDIGQAGGHATAAAAKIPLGLFGSVKNKEALLRLAEEAVADRFFEIVGVEEKEE
ncbi:MAG: potassium transporter TrkA [Euryarchaeota archaeon]|nr:potassium transporter TrkA [Euryarchaeota archaeon]